MIASLSSFYQRVRLKYLKRRLKRAGVKLGKGFRASGHSPQIINDGMMTIGEDVHLRGTLSPIRLVTRPGATIVLGHHVFLNTGVRLYCEAGIVLGDDCRIGDNSVLSDSNFHAVHEGQVPTPRPIRLGRNVWLGRNVIVLPGVTIGDHSVIAAGSVVCEDVPAKQVWRGNPAIYVKDVRASDGFVRV